jgi:polyhydroxybutyrate depolymerase
MRSSSLAVMVSLAICQVSLCATEERLYDHFGVQRSYRLHVPPSYDGTEPMPLVFGLHGMTDNSSNFESTTQLSLYADAQGFLAVYPQALVHSGVTQWNLAFFEGWADDVGFISSLISLLEAEFVVDPNRVFFTGHSNGAFMCNTLAALSPHRIAAICPVAGNLVYPFFPPDGPQVSVLHIQGLADTIVPIEGIAGQYPSLQTYLGWWCDYNHCRPDAVTFFSDDTVTGKIWLSPTGCGDVAFYLVEGMAHYWPRDYYGFSATPAALDFFRAHPRSARSLFYDPNGPVLNATSGVRYNSIQRAILEAQSHDMIVVEPRLYIESLNFAGRGLTVASTAPSDANVVAATRIQSPDQRPVVSFLSESEGCGIAGLTLTGSGVGLRCDSASAFIKDSAIVDCDGHGIKLHAGVTASIQRCLIARNGGSGIVGTNCLGSITDCRIVENRGDGLTLSRNAAPELIHCLIAANRGAGLAMSATTGGRSVTYCRPSITNCTIAQNSFAGVSGGDPVIRNSIVYFNGSGTVAPFEPHAAEVAYSCVDAGVSGQGNISVDPRFVALGAWADAVDPGRPCDPADPNAVWIAGDYHLAVDSPCIDAGDPNDPVGEEPEPNGGIVNMGAFGGTREATRSPIPASNTTP